MRSRLLIITGMGLAISLGHASAEAQKAGPPGRSDRREGFLSQIPAYRGNVILGRPTEQSVTANVMMSSASKVFLKYGTPGRLENRTAEFELKPGEPREIVLDRLQRDSSYEFRIVDSLSGSPLLPEAGNGTFHTQRRRGSLFTFAVQADSHLDGNSDAEVYKLTLANIVAARPDFLIDLGDTFMTGKISYRAAALKQYQAQRYYLGLVGSGTPLFLTIGNHDGEEVAKGRGGRSDDLAAWSCLQRKQLFPNPEPGIFYTGNATTKAVVGLLQDYYAWEWGDALFVVLDPYWYSAPNRGGHEPWNMTLGKAQYDWLAATLRASKARFKFVFIHQLVGGLDGAGRGGAEAVPLFEWGGCEMDGSNKFFANRPGWQKPIHSLLVETGVTIVFHGHDHFFARQEVDGIVYQLVPQPSHGNARKDQAAEYGYAKGDFLPNSGYLRVNVGPGQTAVDYIRTATPEMKRDGLTNGGISFVYVCRAPTQAR